MAHTTPVRGGRTRARAGRRNSVSGQARGGDRGEISARSRRRRASGEPAQRACGPCRGHRHPGRAALGLRRRHRLRDLRRQHLTRRPARHRSLHRRPVRTAIACRDGRHPRSLLRAGHQHTGAQLRGAQSHAARADPDRRHGACHVDLPLARQTQRAAVDRAHRNEERAAAAGGRRDRAAHAGDGPGADDGG